MSDVLELQIGDVVRLSSAADDIVTVSIDGKERFKGEIGLRRFRKSIQITEIIDTEKDAVKRALENFENMRHDKISGVREIVNEYEQENENKKKEEPIDDDE